LNNKAAKMASKVKGKVAVVTAFSALTMKSKNSSDKNKNESEKKDGKNDKIVVMEEEEEEEMDEEEEVIADDIADDAIIDMDIDFGMASPAKSPRSGGDVDPGKYLKPMGNSSSQKSSSKTFTIAIKRRASRLALRTVHLQEEEVVENRSEDKKKKSTSKQLHALEDIDIDF